MNRTRCPTCICGYDGTNNREGVPNAKIIEQMNEGSLIQILGELGIRMHIDGNQIPAISGNLIGICRQTRSRITRQLQKKQKGLQQILYENESD